MAARVTVKIDLAVSSDMSAGNVSSIIEHHLNSSLSGSELSVIDVEASWSDTRHNGEYSFPDPFELPKDDL